MIKIKKTVFLSSLLALLAIGFFLGYLLGSKKSPATKTLYVDNLSNNNNSENAIAKVIPEEIKITAKEAFNLASMEAFLWSDDIYLSEINLASTEFDTEGLSNGWKIIFYSEKNNKFYEILIKDGESRGGKEKEAGGNVQTLKGEMVDSVEMAKSFFSSHTSEEDIISLRMYYSGNAKKFIWTIFYSGGSHTINAELR